MVYLLKKRIFAVLFLLVLLLYAVVNAVVTGPELVNATKWAAGQAEEIPSALKNTLNEELWGRMAFVEAYSFTQTAMGKREFSDFSIIKDEDGYLHYAGFYRERNTELFEYAHRVLRLQKSLAGKGTKVIFVATPSKYLDGEVRLERGLEGNDPYDNVQELLLYLHRLGIHTLDLSQIFSESDAPYLSHFFKTDHHWNVPAAFQATRLLVEDIRETWGDDLDPEGIYTDADSYESTDFPGKMLGSMGRRTGICFSGTEDFSLYTPRFDLRCRRVSVNETDRDKYEGGFAEALLKTSLLAPDHNIYRESLYDTYLDGINDFDHIENLTIPEGEGKKILFINDSYFSPVVAFMTPMCEVIDKVYNLYDGPENSVEALLAENTYDYVIIEVYPYNLDQNAFNYFIRSEQ